MSSVIKIEDLHVNFKSPVLKGVSLDIPEGSSFGLMGESGSGKSTLARVIVGAVKPTSGYVEVLGQDLVTCSKEEKRWLKQAVRMVFQDPAHSFNPRYPVREQLLEIVHNDFPNLSMKEQEELVDRALVEVGLDPSHTYRYPHQLSLGQLQRAALARAISSRPKLLILDESLSALDVTVQVQVLDLILKLKSDIGLTLLFISHDMRLVRACCESVVVLKDGVLVP